MAHFPACEMISTEKKEKKKYLLHQNMPGGCAGTSCHLVEIWSGLSPSDTASFTSTAGGEGSVFS